MNFQISIQRIIRILLVTFLLTWIQPILAAPSLNLGYSVTKTTGQIFVTRSDTSVKVKFPSSAQGNTFNIQLFGGAEKLLISA